MLNRPYYLPKSALLRAWQWSGHGEPPAVLMPDNFWLDDETKKRFEEKVLDVLTTLELAARGSLTPDFTHALRLLARAPQKYTAWLGGIETDETASVLVAVSGAEAVRVVVQDDKARIDPVPADSAVESLVDLLPSVPPARIAAVAIPKSRFSGRPQYEDSYDLVDQTNESTDPYPQIQALMAAKRAGLHQCYAVNEGRRSAPLTAIDILGTGRVLTYVIQPPNGEPVVSFQPGTRENLARSLYATYRGL
ncbi:ESX secretion-associated protein EspG [Amycolatopsis sp. H20-H5]|uniref:ESX secretion-associated protein EspG n=1 Tax=Amycolatopsis sp. H20-H5 TaxID=3046309 RepID=UPI002DB9D7EC|nr:ESX secretion-associated protein EspG [Amycolatopsis sp. H20-H5]MEC3974657.1 ESX secretion-associated protein EspG [Amycolatopsis sp. H20-H5]